jgi:hypothetical protein
MKRAAFVVVPGALLAAGTLLGCGYRAIYGGAQTGRLHVVVVRSAVADAPAAGEVAAGMREELAREGMLESGEGYPRAEVEVLRADFASEGIAASAGVPLARATRVGLVARARVVASPGAEPRDDTSDVRADVVVAIDAASARGEVDLRAAAFHDADAIRAAARRVGRALARRLLGEPAASGDSVDLR